MFVTAGVLGNPAGKTTIKPDRLKLLDAMAARGVGIGAAHYGVEVPTGDPGFAMLRWTGGYFEKYWSVNPTWKATFREFPGHPITRGVKPFAIDDEWYYHMRFVPEMKGITPILAVVPPATTLDRGGDGPHSGNPWVRSEVARGIPQTLMWRTSVRVVGAGSASREGITTGIGAIPISGNWCSTRCSGRRAWRYRWKGWKCRRAKRT